MCGSCAVDVLKFDVSRHLETTCIDDVKSVTNRKSGTWGGIFEIIANALPPILRAPASP